jgi:hypothetical protein
VTPTLHSSQSQMPIHCSIIGRPTAQWDRLINISVDLPRRYCMTGPPVRSSIRIPITSADPQSNSPSASSCGRMCCFCNQNGRLSAH